MVRNKKKKVSRYDSLNPTAKKLISEVVNKSFHKTSPVFKDVEQAMVNFANSLIVQEHTAIIDSPPRIENEVIGRMARQMNLDIDNRLLYGVNSNGDMTIPGCETAKFIDSPGTKDTLRKVIQHSLPIGTDFNTALEELKEVPETIHSTLENLINKHRIDNG